MSKFNHMFDVAFEVINETDDPEDVTNKEVLIALSKRVANLWEEHKDSLNCSYSEAFGHCDSYDVELGTWEDGQKDGK